MKRLILDEVIDIVYDIFFEMVGENLDFVDILLFNL